MNMRAGEAVQVPLSNDALMMAGAQELKFLIKS